MRSHGDHRHCARSLMIRLRKAITTLTVALCIALPVSAQAQRIDALRMGVALNGLAGSIDEHGRGGDSISDTHRPSLGRHSLYGALAGVALWGVYFALPCDVGCRTEG